MNWQKIKEEYPKAYIALEKLMTYSKNTLPFYEYAHWNNRLLYDFFDGKEIWIFPDYEYADDNGAIVFFYQIIDIDNRIPGEYTYKSRLESETAAFTKGFEILENKLK